MSIDSTPIDECQWMETLMARTTATASEPTACCPALGEAPLGEADAAELARAFAALGDPARLRILSLLASAAGGEVCVCDLVDPIGRSQPTVSHHLRVLSEAGLIEGDKRGRWVWYRVVPARLAELRGTLA
jgi:ArsR family transcriptional regulator